LGSGDIDEFLMGSLDSIWQE